MLFQYEFSEQLVVFNMESIQRLADKTNEEYWRVGVQSAKEINRSLIETEKHSQQD